jgi:hypothetical protein
VIFEKDLVRKKQTHACLRVKEQAKKIQIYFKEERFVTKDLKKI